METQRFLLNAAAALAAMLLQTGPASLHAQAHATSALTGQVTSTEEGSMEGEGVSARKDGSTVSISVVTNAQGRFAFPAARLEPGGYKLNASAAASVHDGDRGTCRA